METSDSTATAAGKPMELMMLFDFWFTLDSVCHVLGPKKKILSCKSHDLSGLLTKVNLFLFFFYHPNLTHPPTPPVFAHLFLCTFYTTSCSQSCLFSYSPHSSPSLCFPPPLSSSYMWFLFISFLFLPLALPLHILPLPSRPLPLSPSLSASLAGFSLQWVSIMEAGSGAAAAVGSAALGLLGATATSSHDILDR